MDQVRIIFVSLFPAFLVVTAAQGLSQIPARLAPLRSSLSILARQGGKGLPSHDERAPARILRGWNRRGAIQSGPGGNASAAEVARADFSRFSQFDVTAALEHSSGVLSRPWQFVWRTALEPRAPSSVS